MFKVTKSTCEANLEGMHQNETEEVEPITPLFIDNGPMLKILERRNYDKQKHLFPYNKWKTYELKGLRK